MENFEENFNNFIDENFEDNFKYLRKKPEYKEKSKQFSNLHNKIIDTLNLNEQQLLEELMNCSACMHSSEVLFAYKLGFTNGIKLNNLLQKD